MQQQQQSQQQYPLVLLVANLVILVRYTYEQQQQYTRQYDNLNQSLQYHQQLMVATHLFFNCDIVNCEYGRQKGRTLSLESMIDELESFFGHCCHPPFKYASYDHANRGSSTSNKLGSKCELF
jgi:hypothetical protein